MTLAGGEFIGWGNESGFTGTRDGGKALFTIDTNVTADYALIELIDLKEELHYKGTATATIGEKSIAETFNGTLSLYDRFSRATLGECQAPDHRFELVR